MRTLLIGALAATLVGCSCLLPPQASMEACTDANGLACFDMTAANQPIEPKPASFKANSTTIEGKSTIAAKTKKPSSANARDRTHLAMKTTKATMIAAKVSLRHLVSPLRRPIRSLSRRRPRSQRNWRTRRLPSSVR